MRRFFRWLDATLFSPPHRFDEVLKDMLLVMAAPTEKTPNTASHAPPVESPPLVV